MKFLFSLFKVKYGADLEARGMPVIDIALSANINIGKGFNMNNGDNFNRIGRQQKCFIVAGKNTTLTIGDNVKISSTAIICYHHISIADNVMIGGNTVIYDTDFHSLNHQHRLDRKLDKLNVVARQVTIGPNVFIGAHTTILKGVTIGENSIIAACSVLTKNVGPNELWGGNPAKFLRTI